MTRSVPPPRIERAVTLAFRGDWGGATLHAICGWMGQELLERMSPGTRYAIWNGGGFFDNIRAVSEGGADLAVVTPAASLRMAFAGLGPFSGSPCSNVRAIATLPQRDYLSLAVAPGLGVKNFAGMREKRPPLRIAAAPDDGDNAAGFAVRRIMEASGISETVLRSWGGCYLDAARPGDAARLFAAGAADALFHEAVFADYWQDAAAKRNAVYMPLEADALARMERDYAWVAGELPPGFLPGLERPLSTLLFSDFVVIVRAAMPDDLAYLLAWIACERRAVLERRYNHVPANRSPLTYPMEPARMCMAPIPLHPGAETYYRDGGWLAERGPE